MGNKPHKQLPLWRYDGARIPVYAHTKSEARAKFKLLLGLRRLPVGAVVCRV